MSIARERSSAPVGRHGAVRYPRQVIDAALMAKVKKLSPAKRLELIGAVWESLEPKDLPVTAAERKLIDARIEDETRNPGDSSPWPEAKARLKRRLR